MSELGQMIFGNPSGDWECPEYVEAFVFHVLGEIERVFWNREQRSWDRLEDPKIPGIVFHSYCWGECDCGYEERWEAKDEAWCAEHRHAPSCYQTDLRAAMDAWDARHGYKELQSSVFGSDGVSLFSAFEVEAEEPEPGVSVLSMTPRSDAGMKAYDRAYCARRKHEERVYRRLAAKHGVDSHFGAAVHCTCDYDRQRAEWCATDDHDPACCVARPNLAFGGAEIRWYKHPGRGQTVNVRWKEPRWRKWLDEGMRLVRASEPPAR